MALVAQDTDPVVVPTPVHQQGSVWVTLAAVAGLLLDLIPLVPIPEDWKPWVPVATAVLAWILHQRLGPDEYKPKV